MSADGKMTIWMRLRNAQQVIAGLRKTAAATGVLGSSVDRLARNMERAGRRTFVMNQALFTLRRYSYMLTLALTAGAAAVVKWGFDYNTQVQEARVAFAKFGLSVDQVNTEIADLYKIAAITPFLFTDITTTARRFLAFGIDLATTNRLVTNLTDALTALGVANTASINRASLALAHMYSLGRLTGQIVYQLARDNIPIIQALETELGLTGDQLRNVAALGIPATTAIAALNKYIEETPRFHNAALVFATRTWRGIVTTTRDYIAQFVGTIEEPLFKRMQKAARRFLFWLTSDQVNAFAARGDITGLIGTFSPGLARMWQQFATNLRSVWDIFVHGLIPAFLTVGRIALPILYAALFPITIILQQLSKHTLLAKIFFGLMAAELAVLAIRFAILLPLQLLTMTRMITLNNLQKIAILLGLIRIKTINNETGAVVAQEIVWGRLGKALKLNILLTKTQIFWSTRLRSAWRLLAFGYIADAGRTSYAARSLEGRLLRLRFAWQKAGGGVKGFIILLAQATRAMVMFLLTNPVGWAILLAATFAILYWRWDRFRRAVNSTVLFLWRHPLGRLFLDAISPLIALYDNLRRLYDLILKIYNAARHPIRTAGGFGLRDALRIGAGFLSPLPIPGLAGGGSVTRGGLSLVGENGPELRYLPRGASVIPLSERGGFERPDLGSMVFELYATHILEVDGKKMAESVSKHRLDSGARR